MIPIKNVYYMLSYAFTILNEQSYKDVSTESFENSLDLCAAILIKGISIQIKRGLVKDYVSMNDELSMVRGKVDISSTIRKQSLINNRIYCDYDEFSSNTYLNQILKTTMELLLHADIKRERKKQIKKLLVYFINVDSLDRYHINWHHQYNKNNQTYKMLIAICYMIVKGLIQTNDAGNVRLMNFFDEKNLPHLYEKFILEYYKKEFPMLDTSASQIKWDLDFASDNMLPIMQSDIMLKYHDLTLIIDAKCYGNSVQNYYDSPKLISANLYQIFTYVKNYDVAHNGKTSGMLLYAKTDEQVYPSSEYSMSGNKIEARTLDLNQDFSDIKNQLNEIIYKYFEEISD